ncbi:rCG56275 [Rattus norvegicus]|uniref:RCG56275 n=1 Tax=Rattus norvegicus TaxID=10116 RepID=A6IBL3_RAT|nr:rCG56275 [Rattus norvegicus]
MMNTDSLHSVRSPWLQKSLLMLSKGWGKWKGVWFLSVVGMPKRASRIRKLFNLFKDLVSQYDVRGPLNREVKKPRIKAPRSQCLVIPCILKHKHQSISPKK